MLDTATATRRRPSKRAQRAGAIVLLVLTFPGVSAVSGSVEVGDEGVGREALVQGGSALVINVPEAVGAKTVVGQVAVANASARGFVTAFGCDDGLPLDAAGAVSKADLNFDGTVTSVASNRLIAQADGDGDLCLYTSSPVDLIVDLNGVIESGYQSITNRRTDTRSDGEPIDPSRVLRVTIDEAAGGRTVVGQLAVSGVAERGFVTAYGCDDRLPRDASGQIQKADLNYDGTIIPVSSNRLIVTADDDGDVCFYSSSRADLIVDINGVADTLIEPFGPSRSDTRTSSAPRSTESAFIIEQAVGGKPVFGQLAVAQAAGRGFVTAYGCADGVERDAAGMPLKADLNFDGRITPVASNRLVVKADVQGYVCVFSSEPVALIVDFVGASAAGLVAFDNRRTDTRSIKNPPTITPAAPQPPTTTPGTTTTTSPPQEASDAIQAVYLIPSDATAVAGRADAIAEEIQEVQRWFRDETGGRHPRFQLDGTSVDVATIPVSQTEAQLAADDDFDLTVVSQIRAALPQSRAEVPLAIVYEGTTSDGACGYAVPWRDLVVMPMKNCSIFPTPPAQFPFGMTYLVAHELTHLLGAVPTCAPHALGSHVTDDNRDILYVGPEPRDWDNLALDVGNDDYFRHANEACLDIDDNPLLGFG